MQAAKATLPTGPDPAPHTRQPPSHRREEKRHGSQKHRLPIGDTGAPRRPRGKTVAWLLPEAAARQGAELGGLHEPHEAPRPPAPRGPPAPATGSSSPRAGSCGHDPAPASRLLRPCLTRLRAAGAGERLPRPVGRPRCPGRADNPLPPAERSPAVTGSSLTRAMVAVAILRPSRPPRAPHAAAAAAASAISRDVGEGGGLWGKRRNYRDKRPFRQRRGRRKERASGAGRKGRG